ncbi:MAG: serine/threonine protein kinase [Spirulina sp. DLM2.Bin59]|nr:MAG: serine/threonine protein kinase [Spirulina sp. DLM2.Bin59]
MSTDPNIGRRLSNRYRLVELAGKGAMGRVYRAEDALLGGVTVAVKFLAQTLLNQRMRDRFEREATICALLAEKTMHIVRVKDYGVDEHDVPYYVMEFLEGENLSDMIKNKALPFGQCLNVLRQVCRGLECAHQGILFKGEPSQIIHRDIKPSNILLVQDPSFGELVKLLDFGIAKLVEANRDQTHSFMGTLAYCSPEQMEGKELDSRSDIYSLGVTLYEMLSRDMPLLPENNSFGGWYKAHHDFQPLPLRPELNIPSELSQLVMRCLAKNPDHRPQSARDILQLIEPMEAEYNRTRKLAQLDAIAPTLVREESRTQSSLEQVCWQQQWPKDKPRQKIVFPQLIRASNELYASLWVMLELQDIVNRRSSTRYNQFLFSTIPHPMLLWLTVLYNRREGARWLPCYLDLKTSMGQKITHLLGTNGYYRILFFALENPKQCENLTTTTIDPEQCRRLQDWVQISKGLPNAGQATMSKSLLRQELEKLKPKILMKLEANATQSHYG